MKRQVAANRIITSDNTEIKLGVVELDDTIVTRVYSLQGEQPFTEWIGRPPYRPLFCRGYRRWRPHNPLLYS